MRRRSFLKASGALALGAGFVPQRWQLKSLRTILINTISAAGLRLQTGFIRGPFQPMTIRVGKL